MTCSNSVLAINNTDDLPLPAAAPARHPSASTLPAPVSQANIADSGRISFGNAYRLPSK
jgi:hypothetical protein